MVGSIDIPKNMHLKEKSNLLEFEYSWFKPKYVVSLMAAPLFAYFLIKSDYIAGDFGRLTSPVIILMLASIIVIYYSLAKLMNTTRIRVSHNDIKVNHSPIPFNKNLILKKEDVAQLYVTQHRIGHRYYLYATTYQINAILSNKDVITLVKGLHYPEQGRFIENKIEDFLNITDIHVEGELSKD
ncbi:MAG: hypothetical protein MI975_18820 [Cytophagales bacterium]|nr:hypothetical protein [Cytophagales bacterium]